VRSDDVADLADRSDDRVEVARVGGEHGDVPNLRRSLDPHEVDPPEASAGAADSGGELGEGARAVPQADANDCTEGGGRMRHVCSR
jgi:hypothetical protein